MAFFGKRRGVANEWLSSLSFKADLSRSFQPLDEKQQRIDILEFSRQHLKKADP